MLHGTALSVNKVTNRVSQLLSRRDFTEATKLLSQTIRGLPPSDVKASLIAWLASLEAINKHTGAAARLCEKAKWNNPIDYTPRITLAAVLIQQPGAERRALREARASIRFAKNKGEHAQAYAISALCLLRLGMYGAARRSLTHYRLAWALSRENTFQAVIPEFWLLKEFRAAGIRTTEYQKILRIARRRARRHKLSELYYVGLAQSGLVERDMNG